MCRCHPSHLPCLMWGRMWHKILYIDVLLLLLKHKLTDLRQEATRTLTCFICSVQSVNPPSYISQMLRRPWVCPAALEEKGELIFFDLGEVAHVCYKLLQETWEHCASAPVWAEAIVFSMDVRGISLDFRDSWSKNVTTVPFGCWSWKTKWGVTLNTPGNTRGYWNIFFYIYWVFDTTYIFTGKPVLTLSCTTSLAGQNSLDNCCVKLCDVAKSWCVISWCSSVETRAVKS